jgi:hypothetical protein
MPHARAEERHLTVHASRSLAVVARLEVLERTRVWPPPCNGSITVKGAWVFRTRLDQSEHGTRRRETLPKKQSLSACDTTSGVRDERRTVP